MGVCMPRGAYMARGIDGKGGMHGRGELHAQGTCVAGEGACVGGHAWQERRSLQQAVCILLECILVTGNF